MNQKVQGGQIVISKGFLIHEKRGTVKAGLTQTMQAYTTK